MPAFKLCINVYLTSTDGHKQQVLKSSLLAMTIKVVTALSYVIGK